MGLVGALADQRQSEGRLSDLPRSSDEDHLAREYRSDGGFEVAASCTHGKDTTPPYS